MTKKAILVASYLMVLAASMTSVCAQEQAPSSVDTTKAADLKAAIESADKSSIRGPQDVPLAGQAVLHLPQGYFYVPQPAAGQLSHAFGNPVNARLLGLVGSQNGGGWLAYIDYLAEGHVNDEEGKTWNADDLLTSLKEGTEAGNGDRQSRGFPALEVVNWIEAPAYDSASHHLVWSALVRQKNDQTAHATANYNTYALGRDGHFELDLVADADKIGGFKENAKELLGGLEFDKGHRYSDYDASKDRLAAYGLAALVGGVAAKKLGLIALVGALAVKFAKLIGLAVLAGLASVRKLFGGKGTSQGPGPDQVA